jgi:hypothetical protein
MSERASEKALRPVRHEIGDISPRLILGLFVLTGVLLLLLGGLAWLLFPAEVKDDRFKQPFPSWPAPALQSNPTADMDRFHAEEMRQLNTAGWQDRAAGTLHIPIEQAMHAVAAEGIPGWPTGGTRLSEGDRR